MKKTRVLVLAGGQSGEHEVSINSARSVLQALPTADFDVTSIVVSKEGRWLSLTESSEALRLGSAPNSGELVLHAAKLAQSFDVVFPILHGPNGEDGTVQGLLKLAGLPYVGSGVLGSALCMDKVMAKAVTATLGIPQVPYQLVTRAEYFHQPEATTSNVLARLSALNFPVFVKPANLGSSVGISKARSTEELKAALSLAFQHDRRVIVEAATADKPRELEVGILGNDHPQASVVGELSSIVSITTTTPSTPKGKRKCISLRRFRRRWRNKPERLHSRPFGRSIAQAWLAWISSTWSAPVSFY
jgi:D-alanine-D-alanine ligase